MFSKLGMHFMLPAHLSSDQTYFKFLLATCGQWPPCWAAPNKSNCSVFLSSMLRPRSMITNTQQNETVRAPDCMQLSSVWRHKHLVLLYLMFTLPPHSLGLQKAPTGWQTLSQCHAHPQSYTAVFPVPHRTSDCWAWPCSRVPATVTPLQWGGLLAVHKLPCTTLWTWAWLPLTAPRNCEQWPWQTALGAKWAVPGRPLSGMVPQRHTAAARHLRDVSDISWS